MNWFMAVFCCSINWHLPKSVNFSVSGTILTGSFSNPAVTKPTTECSSANFCTSPQSKPSKRFSFWFSSSLPPSQRPALTNAKNVSMLFLLLTSDIFILCSSPLWPKQVRAEHPHRPQILHFVFLYCVKKFTRGKAGNSVKSHQSSDLILCVSLPTHHISLG